MCCRSMFTIKTTCHLFAGNLDELVGGEREGLVAEVGVGQRLEDGSRLRALERDHGHRPRLVPDLDVEVLVLDGHLDVGQVLIGRSTGSSDVELAVLVVLITRYHYYES